jgi:hypothetical protein
VPSAGTGADYRLAWPRLLFQNETAALVNNTKLDDWVGRCELLLEDAFIGVAPRDDFMAEPAPERRSFLIRLLRAGPFSPEGSYRLPGAGHRPLA